MARFAIIQNNSVTNLAVSDTALADNWIASEVAAIGDIYENDEFIKPPPPPVPVPQSVTPRQARLALFGAGLLAQVETAIAGMDEPTKTVATINWEYATAIVRSDEWVLGLGGALGMTDAQLDELFRTAATL